MDPSFVKAIVDNGISVVLAAMMIWLVWHVFTKGMPQLVTNFAVAHEKTLSTFAEALKDEREANALLASEERAACDRRTAEVTAAIRDLMSLETTHHEQILASFKEERHYINGLAQLAGLKVALQKEERKIET